MGQHAYPNPLDFINRANQPYPRDNAALDALMSTLGGQVLGDRSSERISANQIGAENTRLDTQIGANVDASAIQALAAKEEANTDRTFQTRAAGTLAANAAGARAQQLYRERIIQKLKNTGLSEQAAIEAASRIAVQESANVGQLDQIIGIRGLFTPQFKERFGDDQALSFDSNFKTLQAVDHSTVLKNLADSGVGALSPKLAGSLGELATDRSYYPPNPALFKGVSQENAAKSELEAQRTVVKTFSQYIFAGRVIDVPSKVDFTETTRMTAGLKEAQGLIALLHWPLADLRSIGFERGIDKRTGNTFVGRRDAGGKITVLIEGVPE